MYNVALLDDEISALNAFEGVVKEFFSNHSFPVNITKFTSSLNFLASSKETKFDLVFLDIDMPLKNGIEVGKELISINPEINIIFLSAREDMVFDCLSLHPFGFIRKSKFKQDFNSVMEQFNDSVLSLENDDEKIDFIKKNNVSSYRIREIMYIEGVRNYQELHLKNGNKELIRISMNELEDKLKEKGFIRVHKGFIVNYLFIRSISKDDAILLNGNLIPLSKKRREEIIEEYLNTSRNKNCILKI